MSRLQVNSKRREQSVQKLRIGHTYSPHKCRLDRVMNVGRCIHARVNRRHIIQDYMGCGRILDC